MREGIYHDADRCAAETKALLELPQPPTCIIFPDDFSALGGYNAISEAGLSIPEDISVMGYDGIYLAGGQASAGDLPAEHRRAGPHSCRQAH